MVKLANPQHETESLVLESIAWAALEKVAQKQKDADQIPDGSQHTVTLNIDGNVDGQPFQQSINSVLSIGHRQIRSSSVNPQVPQLVAWILSKLNRVTRNRMLLDIPVEFAAGGNRIPESSEVLVAEVEQMLKLLRQTKTVEARGPVRCEYTL